MPGAEPSRSNPPGGRPRSGLKAENVWEFMRDNWLSNRVFTCYCDIVDHCAFAWNKLAAEPWRIVTLGLCNWAHRC